MKTLRETESVSGLAFTTPEGVDSEGAGDDASTRQRVQQSIMQFGPSTAAELAERLQLTPAAIRRHLGVLTDRGDLVSREQRVHGARGRGRPARVFCLTGAGRRSFHQAYDDLAATALAQLVRVAGADALEELARSRAEGVAARYQQLRETDPQGSPVDALAEALSADGYVASAHPARAGEQLCQHHCPVAQVAEQFPQLCEAETRIFGQLLGVPVQRLATIAHGDGVCTTHISTRAAAQPEAGDTSATGGTSTRTNPGRLDPEPSHREPTDSDQEV